MTLLFASMQNYKILANVKQILINHCVNLIKTKYTFRNLTLQYRETERIQSVDYLNNSSKKLEDFVLLLDQPDKETPGSR